MDHERPPPGCRPRSARASDGPDRSAPGVPKGRGRGLAWRRQRRIHAGQALVAFDMVFAGRRPPAPGCEWWPGDRGCGAAPPKRRLDGSSTRSLPCSALIRTRSPAGGASQAAAAVQAEERRLLGAEPVDQAALGELHVGVGEHRVLRRGRASACAPTATPIGRARRGRSPPPPRPRRRRGSRRARRSPRRPSGRAWRAATTSTRGAPMRRDRGVAEERGAGDGGRHLEVAEVVGGVEAVDRPLAELVEVEIVPLARVLDGAEHEDARARARRRPRSRRCRGRRAAPPGPRASPPP